VYSTKPLPLMTLVFVNSPYDSKWALKVCSVVSNESPWTKSSNLPACSPEASGVLASSAGVASAFLSFAGSPESESDPEPLPESLPLPDDEDAFLACFLAGAAFFFGAEESELSESDELLTFYFLAGGALALALALLLALAALLALKFEAALALLAGTFKFLPLAESEESESLSLSELLILASFFFFEDSLAAAAFLAASLAATSFLAASFLALFFESSRLCFLDGGSDELELELELATGFLVFPICTVCVKIVV